MISFKGAQYPKDVILFAVFFYVRYGVSYRDLEEIMSERGVAVDHTTLNRWVTKYASATAEVARRGKGPCDRSWRMDETYIKVKGAWGYLYRAVDKHGKTLDFMLSERRNKPAATKFFARMLECNGLPRKIVIDKSGANTAGIGSGQNLGVRLRPCDMRWSTFHREQRPARWQRDGRLWVTISCVGVFPCVCCRCRPRSLLHETKRLEDHCDIAAHSR